MTAFGPSRRLTAVAGALLMATGVVIGAFGAHWLANLLTPERLSTLRTAVDYQFLNGLGLLLVAALDRDQRPLSLPAALLLAGALLFCGALYALVATDVGLFGRRGADDRGLADAGAAGQSRPGRRPLLTIWR